MIEASKVNIAKIIEANKIHIQGRSEFLLYNVMYLDEPYKIKIHKVSKKSSVKEYINGKIVYRKIE